MCVPRYVTQDCKALGWMSVEVCGWGSTSTSATTPTWPASYPFLSSFSLGFVLSCVRSQRSCSPPFSFSFSRKRKKYLNYSSYFRIRLGPNFGNHWVGECLLQIRWLKDVSRWWHYLTWFYFPKIFEYHWKPRSRTGPPATVTMVPKQSGELRFAKKDNFIFLGLLICHISLCD